MRYWDRFRQFHEEDMWDKFMKWLARKEKKKLKQMKGGIENNGKNKSN